MRIEEIEKHISRIDVKIEKLRLERSAWLKAISIYEQCKMEPIGEYPESAYRAYIITGTVADAAHMLNSAGQRNGAKRFAANDISNAIDNVDIDNADLMNVAKFLLSNGRKFINLLFN